MPDTHALLSPSSSERWISCPPSVRMSEGIEEKPSEYAAEGTAAHSLCEYKLRELLGYKQSDIRENLDYYNEEMEDCTEEYRNYINELLAENNGRKPLMFVEQRVDFSRFVKEGFGTSDCIIIDNDTIYIIDFKYGKGVEVNAVNNTQMMIYAIGALEMFDGIFDINHVIMTIFQPRLSNISTFEMTKDELYHWAFNVLKPAADMAYQGTGTFKCGDHCRFCKAKTICRARAEYNLKLAQYDFKMPDTLDDENYKAVPGAQSCSPSDSRSDFTIPADDGIWDSGSEWSYTDLEVVFAETELETISYLTGADIDTEKSEIDEGILDSAPEVALSFSALRADGGYRLYRYWTAKCTGYTVQHQTKGQSQDAQIYTLRFRCMPRKNNGKIRATKDIAKGAALTWIKTFAQLGE